MDVGGIISDKEGMHVYCCYACFMKLHYDNNVEINFENFLEIWRYFIINSEQVRVLYNNWFANVA